MTAPERLPAFSVATRFLLPSTVAGMTAIAVFADTMMSNSNRKIQHHSNKSGRDSCVDADSVYTEAAGLVFDVRECGAKLVDALRDAQRVARAVDQSNHFRLRAKIRRI